MPGSTRLFRPLSRRMSGSVSRAQEGLEGRAWARSIRLDLLWKRIQVWCGSDAPGESDAVSKETRVAIGFGPPFLETPKGQRVRDVATPFRHAARGGLSSLARVRGAVRVPAAVKAGTHPGTFLGHPGQREGGLGTVRRGQSPGMCV
ncbi:hypothetical protein A8A10_05465 [Klebsiella pneumoniae]|nr:hypothetical protein A8A10_05465 [Klebsiella pneumoniae]